MNWLANSTGMDRFEARKGCYQEVGRNRCPCRNRKMTHSVGHSERTGVPVEATFVYTMVR